MRIGIEAQRIFRAKTHGMDVVAIELIKNLQEVDKKNDYVIYAAPGENTAAIKETPNFKIKLIKGISYFDWEQIWLPLQAKKDQLDVLHCTSNTAPISNSIRQIVTIHDTIFVEKQNWPVNVNWYQKLGNQYRRLLVPYIAKSCKKVVTPTEFERANLIQYFKLNRSKIEIVPNGVNDSFRRITDSSLLGRVREKYSLPDRFLFYLGNTEPRKNIHNLLKAYSEISSSDGSVPNLVITNIQSSFLESVLKKLNQEKLSEKIILVGYVDSSDLPALYSLADFFLYPSLREGFGLPILEAMACGTPVITSLASAMPEIAQNAALLVDPFDYKQIKEAMAKLVRNDQLKEDLKEKGLERAKAFSWKASAEKILSIYETFK